MLKTRKRWVALLTAVCMIAAFCVPFVGTASASTTYSLSYVPAVSAGATYTSALGTLTNLYLTVTMDNTSAMNLGGSQVVLALPSTPIGYAMTVEVAPNSFTGVFASTTNTVNTLSGASLASTNGSVTLTIPTAYNTGNPGGYTGNATSSSFALQFISLTVPGGVNGNVTLSASAPNGSMFASGVLTIATAGSGNVTLASESVQAVSSGTAQPVGIIDITESMARSLTNSGGTALKLTLPPGVTWDSTVPGATFGLSTPVWGAWGTGFGSPTGAIGPTIGNGYLTITSNGGRELDISVPTTPIVNSSNVVTGYVYESSSAVFTKLTASVDIDQSVAKQGNIVVTVSGASTYTPSTLTVANYGTYAVTDKVLSTPTITAGLAGSTIGEFELLESLPGSLMTNRTIDLTLPSDVAWSEVPQVDTANSTLDQYSIQSIDAVGSSGNEIEITIGGYPSTAGENPAVIALKNAEVTPAVDFTGALNVTVGGTEGLSGTINLGTVATGVTATTSATPDLTIGTASASVGNMTITEAAAANIQSIAEYSSLDASGDSTYNSAGATTNKYFVATNSNDGTAEIDVWAPTGVTFFNTPTVTVTAGDLQLGTISTNTIDNQGELVIPIKSSSTTAATISITGTQVTVDRTVPEGPITFKVKGTGVDETQLDNTSGNAQVTGTSEEALFPNDTTATSANVANVTTAAAPGGAGTSVFKIGATSYTLNGNSVNIDVAPFIQDSRTFLPLRYVANALGVADSNIMFDPTTQKVTIIKGSMVVQLTIGSTTMLLNGATITMDTAPEITSGRTCLPVAWVAQALNANVVWDATAQTVTITSN